MAKSASLVARTRRLLAFSRVCRCEVARAQGLADWAQERSPLIIGTGVDLEEVDRIRRAIDRHGRRFLERVFTPGEIAYVDDKANRFERYAARFAAKEAAMKALGTGWDCGLRWVDIEVVNAPNGRPSLRFTGRAAELARDLGCRSSSLSLSHTRSTAVAQVILEG